VVASSIDSSAHRCSSRACYGCTAQLFVRFDEPFDHHIDHHRFAGRAARVSAMCGVGITQAS
jgi:hypothetical protein